MKTLYISDLDGTLLNGAAQMSAYTAQALNRMMADGLNFSVATARTAASAAVILAGVRWHIPIVLMNGVLIYDSAQKRYAQTHTLAAETAASVVAALKGLRVTGLMYTFEGGAQQTYYESLEHKPVRDFVEERIVRYHKQFQQTPSFADIPPEHIIYFTLIDTHESLLPVHDALSALSGISSFMYKDNYSPDLWYLEIHSDRASKQNGVDFLRRAYGFERVVGFGDNVNDLPMFAACDWKVAVANARDEVLAAADEICGPNEDDGVVKWLEGKILA